MTNMIIKNKVIDSYVRKNIENYIPNFTKIFHKFSSSKSLLCKINRQEIIRKHYFNDGLSKNIEEFLMIIYDIQNNQIKNITKRLDLFIQSNPDFNLARLLLSRLNAIFNLPSVKKNDLILTLKYFPDDAFLNNAYGNYLGIILGKKKESHNFLKKSVNIEPDNEEYIIDFAFNSFTLGKINTSKKSLINAFQIFGKKNNRNIEYINLDDIGQILILLKNHENKKKLVILLILLVSMIHEYYGNFSEIIKINLLASNLYPEIKELKFYLGLMYLHIGKKSHGFKLIYEANIDNRNRGQNILSLRLKEIPRLSKKNFQYIDDKHILVWLEQGFGDHLHFARYIPLLSKRVKKISVFGPLSVMELLKYSPEFKNINLLSRFKDDNFSLQTYLFDLPYLLDCSNKKINSFSLNIKKLRNNKKNLLKTFSQYTLKPKKKIGIFHSGSQIHLHNHFRAIPIEQFSDLFENSEYQFFLLNKNIENSDKKFINSYSNITSCNKLIKNWSDTACIASELDMIITCDSSLAHLGGCMNISTVILLNEVCDWRWDKKGKKSELYSSIKIMRKEKNTEWRKLIKKIIIN